MESEQSMYQPADTSTGSHGGRPNILTTRGVVSAGHYLAAEVGLRILQAGGNAMDAAAATGFALGVLKPHQNGIAGEAPVLLYEAGTGTVHAVSGHGNAPQAATIEHFRNLGLAVIPGDGLLPAVVPPAVATWILLLRRFGTMRLHQVLAPALELAEGGFPIYKSLHAAIGSSADRFLAQWPSSAEKFLPGGAAPGLGTVWKQPDWAATFKQLADADLGCRDREQGLSAARDCFYRGEIADRIAEFCRNTPVLDSSEEPHTGLLDKGDMAAYSARVETPAQVGYRGIDVFKCPPWSQGPVLLQMLGLLEGYDLAEMGHNSADYVHTVVECMKLAFADRDFYYGDPEFVDVPLERLLSKEYAAERRGLVDPGQASHEQRPEGHEPLVATELADVEGAFAPGAGDTTKLEVIDGEGNMVSATPSGGWLSTSPVVPGLGFPLGTRGQMFSLMPGHPNALQPGKRPRTTLTPSLALRDGRPWMAFGSPGGDCQDQWALQFLLNVVEFGMSLQEAVEAPTFWTRHCISSFYPRTAEPGSLHVEGRIAEDVRDELSTRGHILHAEADWAGGNTLAASIDPDTGVLTAAASPRLDPAYAMGW